jgi:hypothetical protein
LNVFELFWLLSNSIPKNIIKLKWGQLFNNFPAKLFFGIVSVNLLRNSNGRALKCMMQQKSKVKIQDSKKVFPA